MVSYWGYQLNVRNVEINEANVEINKRNSEISKRQLEIIENDKKPHFVIKRDFIPDNTKQLDDMEKVPKYSYTITNEGGDISEVSIFPESYIYFYIPTSVEQEYYIFKCVSHDFEVGGGSSIGMIEKDKEFIFCEYVFKDNGASEWESLGKSVSEYFPSIKCIHKNFIRIYYTDYMGEHQEKIFEFNDSYVKEPRDEEGYILLEAGLDYSLDYVPEIEETVEKIKKEIENWLEKNEGSKGYEIPHGMMFQYFG